MHAPLGDPVSPSELHSLRTGLSALLHGEPDLALSELNTAVRLAHANGTHPIGKAASAALGVVHGLQGRLQFIEPQLDRFDWGVAPSDTSESTRHAERAARAFLAVEQLAPDADRRLHEVDMLDPLNEFWPIALLLRGRLALTDDAPSQVFDDVSLAGAVHGAPVTGLAADIVASLSVEAFARMHELPAAFRSLEEAAGAVGPFTRIARIHLLILNGQLAEANREVRDILSSPVSSAYLRDEALATTAWIAFEQRGRVDANVASAVTRLVIRDEKRRIFTMLPEPVIRTIEAELPEETAELLRARLDGLTLAAPQMTMPGLTAAERRVLHALSDHDTVGRAAEALFVSPNTVKTHLAAIYRKLGVHGRQEALQEASRRGLLPASAH